MFIEEGPIVPGPWWIAHPQEIADRFDTWAAEYPRYVRLIRKHTFRGYPVTGCILTDHEGGKKDKKRVLIAAVPHGHEPAGSAAIMNFIAGMLTGRDLQQQPFPLDGPEVLKEIACLLVSAGNADGFARSPILYWDGTRASYHYYHDVASGVLEDGRRFGRAVPEWSEKNHDIRRVGIHYEEVAAGEWVEPHLSKRGTCWKVMQDLMAEYTPDFFLNMHQGELGGYNCGFGETSEAMPVVAYVKMPTEEWIPRKSQELGRRMAERLWTAWEAEGLKTVRTLYDYAGKPASWRDKDGRRRKWMMDWLPELYGSAYLTLEVHVNNPRVPVEKQLAAGTVALVASVRGLLEEERIGHTPAK